MDKARKMAALFAACIIFSGCASGGGDGAPSGGDKGNTAGSSKNEGDKSDSIRNEGDNSDSWEMPVIDIKTKNTSSLDFVTKPVTRHVAESILSWTPGYVIPEEPYYEECTVTVTGADKSVLIDGADASVKVRGNWTTTYEKKPLRIKFDEKRSMLGLNGGGEYKNWLLLAEYKDWSMMRNKTAFTIAKELLGKDGYYCADSTLAEVRINGEYWGVYLLAEQQQTGKGRVDIAEPEKDYTGTDIGYFLEYDGYYTNEEPLNAFRVSYHNDAPLKPYDGSGGSNRLAHAFADGMNEVGFTIKSDIYSQEQHDCIAGFVENAYNIMYEAAYNDKAYVMNADMSGITEDSSLTPQQAVEKVVDTRSLADAYLLAELTCDADLYWSSFYMSADLSAEGNGKLTFQAPWDFDSGLGNKDRCLDGTGFYAGNIIYDVNGQWECMCNPWLMVLMYEDWYQDIIKDRWTELSDSGVIARAAGEITSDSEKYSDSFRRNYDKWGNISEDNTVASELSRGALACRDQKQAAEFLRSWLEKRAAFLDSAWHR